MGKNKQIIKSIVLGLVTICMFLVIIELSKAVGFIDFLMTPEGNRFMNSLWEGILVVLALIPIGLLILIIIKIGRSGDK